MRLRQGLLATATAATLMGTIAMAPRADAAARVIVTPAFGFSYGFGPSWYGPWGPSYVYVPGPATGDVKVNTKIKGESIYVDGGLAGYTGKLKKFSLRPGNHQIEIRDASGRILFEDTVHVIGGKTVDINC